MLAAANNGSSDKTSPNWTGCRHHVWMDRTDKRKPGVNPLLVFFGVAALLVGGGYVVRVAFGVAALGVMYVTSNQPGIDFDAGAWRAQGNTGASSGAEPRLRMVASLTTSGRLEGKTRTEVRELLGPTHFDEAWDEAETFYYILGDGLIDPWIFSIGFGEDGKVQAYRKFNG